MPPFGAALSNPPLSTSSQGKLAVLLESVLMQGTFSNRSNEASSYKSHLRAATVSFGRVYSRHRVALPLVLVVVSGQIGQWSQDGVAMRRSAALFAVASLVLLFSIPLGESAAAADVCPKISAGGNWVQVCVEGDPLLVPSVRQCGSDCVAIDITGEGGQVSIDCGGVVNCEMGPISVPSRNMCVASVAVRQADESCLIFVEGG